MQDLWRLSAADLATLVKSKKVSAREAAKAGLARLDAVNPQLNAVIEVTDVEGEIVLEFPFTEALLDMPDQSATRH